jgi:outer membrane protein TolC
MHWKLALLKPTTTCKPPRCPTSRLSLGLPSDVALRRPNIQIARAQLPTASIGIDMADLDPRVTLGADFGSQSAEGGASIDGGSRRAKPGMLLRPIDCHWTAF